MQKLITVIIILVALALWVYGASTEAETLSILNK